jgi:hypothetical protein
VTDNNNVIPLGLSQSEIDGLMDPLLSVEDRQSAWRVKPLSVQARRIQQRWESALNGPLVLGLASCAVAFIGLNIATFSENWRLVGASAILLWYPVLFYVVYEMNRFGALKVNEI